MKLIAFIFPALLVLPLLVLSSNECIAQTKAGPVSIVQLTTGWNADQFGLFVDAPVSNPFGCSLTDMYSVDSTTPGYKTYYAAALTAFATGKTVYVFISNYNCTATRPTIIGITVNK